MHYKAIFEIGPIYDYLRSTRKTRDLWGGSFLFSYLMGYTAKLILENELGKFDLNSAPDIKRVNEIILRPNVTDDKLFQRICKSTTGSKVDAGSIPDQLYCRLQKATTPDSVIEGIKKELRTIYENCIMKVLDNYKPDPDYNSSSNIVEHQINNFFRLFYVIDDDSTDQEKLNNAIASRGSIFEFDSFVDDQNYTLSKDEKCSLCGDRKKVISLYGARRNNRAEHLCAICVIKRGLLDHFQYIVELEKFKSTTMIASTAAQKEMVENFDTLEDQISSFVKAHEKSPEASDDLNKKQMNNLINSDITREVIGKLSYQFYFSNQASDFRNQVQKLTKEENKVWVDSPFFAILAADGDNTGAIMKVCEGHGLLDDMSKAIHNYTKATTEIIQNAGGQLIFCGGEDTLAIIHPGSLISVTMQLDQAFKNSFNELKSRLEMENFQFSISAGCVICHHKYPLSLAVSGAHYMLDGVAKQEDGKASLAVSLIKGGSEKSQFLCKISGESFNLEDFSQLVEKEIPRSFVFKLMDEYEILYSTLENEDELVKYVKFVFEKTRIENIAFDESLKKLVRNSFKTINGKLDFEQLINRLYFARFLKGGE